MKKTGTAHPIAYQGSKRKIAQRILERFPRRVHTLYEPFAGSAAVSLAAAKERRAQAFHLNDSFGPLIQLWEQIVSTPGEVADGYEALWHAQGNEPRTFFEEIRSRFNRTHDPVALLFLLARCVKSAVRFNASGEFNQAADRRRRGTHPDRMRAQLVGASSLLGGRVTFSAVDYAAAVAGATPDDLVYLDPPYQGTSVGRDSRYHQGLEPARFVRDLEELLSRKVPVIVSYDGRSGQTVYGDPLPPSLGLSRVEISAGRSAQATLLGSSRETVESLYLSPELLRSSPYPGESHAERSRASACVADPSR